MSKGASLSLSRIQTELFLLMKSGALTSISSYFSILHRFREKSERGGDEEVGKQKTAYLVCVSPCQFRGLSSENCQVTSRLLNVN